MEQIKYDIPPKELFKSVKQEKSEEEIDLRKEIVRIFTEEDIVLLLADNLLDRLVDFISQLLSQRAFSKEELRLLNAYLSLALPEYNNFDKETKMHEDMDKLHKILEKISKLLKE